MGAQSDPAKARFGTPSGMLRENLGYKSPYFLRRYAGQSHLQIISALNNVEVC